MKKIELKPLLISIGLILFQTICFYTAKLLESNPTLIGNFIDSKIPFKVIFIIPYCIWYFMLLIVPYYFYKKDKRILNKFIISYIICVLIGMITFIIFPTTVNRPTVTGTSIIDWMARIVFYCDTPILNCFPSLHCAISMLFLTYMFKCKDTKLYIKLITAFISILIMISTLFVKQHVFIDLVSGDILALITFIIISKENKLTSKIEKII